MADLRSRFIEDYAGGLLNIARQELSSTGEVLSQDGLTTDGTLFVEDGTGVKSGLRLGVGLAEVVDPTTPTGIVNVRFGDRTYAKIRDLKLFSTAVASAQAALSEATSISISNIETTLQLLEDDLASLEQNLQQTLVRSQQQLDSYSLFKQNIEEVTQAQEVEIQQLQQRVSAIETPTDNPDSIEKLTSVPNNIYYPGSIEINSGTVTGTNTTFEETFTTGDVFVSTTSTGEVIEFTIVDISSQTEMRVRPSNKNIATSSRYERPRELEMTNKINEILSVLKKLKFVV